MSGFARTSKMYPQKVGRYLGGTALTLFCGLAQAQQLPSTQPRTPLGGGYSGMRPEHDSNVMIPRVGQSPGGGAGSSSPTLSIPAPGQGSALANLPALVSVEPDMLLVVNTADQPFSFLIQDGSEAITVTVEARKARVVRCKTCQQGRVPVAFNDAREAQTREFRLGSGVIVSWNGATSRYQLASASP